jgi:GNAT superfamily N-acetyltransferase
MLKCVYTDGRNQDFIELCRQLDENLDELVGGFEQRKNYVQYNTLENIHDVILFYDKDNPCACASFKHYEEDTAEMKRVFVRQEYRGQGISVELIQTLETLAKEKGYRNMILETGKPLVAATKLYLRMGYKVIDNYGQYKNLAESICMNKVL